MNINLCLELRHVPQPQHQLGLGGDHLVLVLTHLETRKQQQQHVSQEALWWSGLRKPFPTFTLERSLSRNVPTWSCRPFTIESLPSSMLFIPSNSLHTKLSLLHLTVELFTFYSFLLPSWGAQSGCPAQQVLSLSSQLHHLSPRAPGISRCGSKPKRQYT